MVNNGLLKNNRNHMNGSNGARQLSFSIQSILILYKLQPLTKPILVTKLYRVGLLLPKHHKSATVFDFRHTINVFRVKNCVLQM